MGTSTDGILCYGFHLTDEEDDYAEVEWLKEHDGDFEEFCAHLAGLEQPEHHDYKRDWPEYWKAKREAHAALNVDMVQHCSCDYGMYILAVKDSVHGASRGYPKKLGQKIDAMPGWVTSLRDFCERINIPYKDPEWILCSYWSW